MIPPYTFPEWNITTYRNFTLIKVKYANVYRDVGYKDWDNTDTVETLFMNKEVNTWALDLLFFKYSAGILWALSICKM